MIDNSNLNLLVSIVRIYRVVKMIGMNEACKYFTKLYYQTVGKITHNFGIEKSAWKE